MSESDKLNFQEWLQNKNKDLYDHLIKEYNLYSASFEFNKSFQVLVEGLKPAADSILGALEHTIKSFKNK